jgi:membrane associated rhomboid family serine protease
MAQRPRARGGFQRFFGPAQITRGALYLLFATAGLSLVFVLGGDEMKLRMTTLMVASGQSVWGDFKLWQLATSPILETSFVSLLFQAFTLWMFLPALERWWGMKRFLMFAATTSVVGVAVGTLLGALLGGTENVVGVSGLDPFVFGGIVAYGVLFANQPVQFFGVLPMTGKQLAWGISAFAALFILLGQSWVEGAALGAGMITAWAMTSQRASPRLWLLKAKQRRLRKRGHLKVVGGKNEKRWMN